MSKVVQQYYSLLDTVYTYITLCILRDWVSIFKENKHREIHKHQPIVLHFKPVNMSIETIVKTLLIERLKYYIDSG